MLTCLCYGDLVDSFTRTDGAKRGRWASPQNTRSTDRASCKATLLGSLGHTLKEALEGIRAAITDASFAVLVCQAKDEIDLDLSEHLNSIAPDPSVDKPTSSPASYSSSTDTLNNSPANPLAPSSRCSMQNSPDALHHPIHPPLVPELPSTGPSIANLTLLR